MTDIVTTSNLKAYYITQAFGMRRTIKAVDGISLAIRENEILGIAGESGCGKSTLLKVLLGIIKSPLKVVEGSVTYNFGSGPRDALSLTDSEKRAMRWKEISYIPQGSMNVLNPVRKVRDTFRDFISVHIWKSRAEMDDMVASYLKELGLPEKVLNSYPHQLSGGMRQRVTIALATILSPKLILADEPTSALDVVVQRGVIQLLDEVRQHERNTLVVVTHDMGVHANLTNRIAVLYAGQMMEEADTQTIFKHPSHPYTQHLIRSLPEIDDKSERVSIPGQPPALDHPPSGCRFHPRCPYAKEICREETPPLVKIELDHRVACHLVSSQISTPMG